jgi:DNA processing protein
MSTQQDLKYWVGFNLVKGIGPAKLQALLDHFGDLAAAWQANVATLQAIGIDRRAVESLLAARDRLELDMELKRIEQAGVHVLTWADPAYPARLRQISGAPPLLYVKGALTDADRWAVGVVGTRHASAYGRQATRELASSLARSQVTVVSGLARGIDAEAHQAALDTGGRTIAVMGCGLDQVYPPEHRRLAEAIGANGALISEYPLGEPPDASNFPPRNRIISGLSLGVLVVEAGARSGALITAAYAAEQGRDVFAVPGSILMRGSEGTNRLIQDGAKMVTKPEDLLEELNLTLVAEQAEVRQVVPDNPTEAQLLKYLSAEPIHVDEIAASAGMPITDISATLALMELKGMVRQVGGMNYVLSRERRAAYVVE